MEKSAISGFLVHFSCVGYFRLVFLFLIPFSGSSHFFLSLFGVLLADFSIFDPIFRFSPLLFLSFGVLLAIFFQYDPFLLLLQIFFRLLYRK